MGVFKVKISRRKFLGATGAAAATVALRPILRLSQAIAAQTDPLRYNIVCIMTDDQDYVSLPVMRHLRSYPRGSWIEFDNFICNDGICGPSRASLYTGLYTRNHGIVSNPVAKWFDTETHSLPVWLKSAGYTTAMIGKYLFGSRIVKNAPGWDHFQQGGLAAIVKQRSLNFLSSVQEPFFLMATPIDPHKKAKPQNEYTKTNVWVPPVDPPSFNEDTSDKSSWVRDAEQRPGRIRGLRAERVRAHRALLGVDDMVLAIIEKLEERNMLDNTVICFLSDNGFLWGEHGLAYKHWHYEEVVHLPLLMRFPDLNGENRRESRVVGMVDLAPTFAEIAGAEPSRPLDGRSLLPMIQNPTVYWDEAVLLEKFPEAKANFSFTGVRVPGWTYVIFSNYEEEMYDLTADPYQLDNVAYDPVYAGMKHLLLAKMNQLIDGAPRPTATPTVTPTPAPVNPHRFLRPFYGGIPVYEAADIKSKTPKRLKFNEYPAIIAELEGANGNWHNKRWYQIEGGYFCPCLPHPKRTANAVYHRWRHRLLGRNLCAVYRCPHCPIRQSKPRKIPLFGRMHRQSEQGCARHRQPG